VEAENGFMTIFTTEAGPKKKNLFGRALTEAGAGAAFETLPNTPLHT